MPPTCREGGGAAGRRRRHSAASPPKVAAPHWSLRTTAADPARASGWRRAGAAPLGDAGAPPAESRSAIPSPPAPPAGAAPPSCPTPRRRAGDPCRARRGGRASTPGPRAAAAAGAVAQGAPRQPARHAAWLPEQPSRAKPPCPSPASWDMQGLTPSAQPTSLALLRRPAMPSRVRLACAPCRPPAHREHAGARQLGLECVVLCVAHDRLAGLGRQARLEQLLLLLAAGQGRAQQAERARASVIAPTSEQHGGAGPSSSCLGWLPMQEEGPRGSVLSARHALAPSRRARVGMEAAGHGLPAQTRMRPSCWPSTCANPGAAVAGTLAPSNLRADLKESAAISSAAPTSAPPPCCPPTAAPASGCQTPSQTEWRCRHSSTPAAAEGAATGGPNRTRRRRRRRCGKGQRTIACPDACVAVPLSWLTIMPHTVHGAAVPQQPASQGSTRCRRTAMASRNSCSFSPVVSSRVGRRPPSSSEQ